MAREVLYWRRSRGSSNRIRCTATTIVIKSLSSNEQIDEMTNVADTCRRRMKPRVAHVGRGRGSARRACLHDIFHTPTCLLKHCGLGTPAYSFSPYPCLCASRLPSQHALQVRHKATQHSHKAAQNIKGPVRRDQDSIGLVMLPARRMFYVISLPVSSWRLEWYSRS